MDMGQVRMSCMGNGYQGKVAGVSFWHNYSIHQHALALEVGYNFVVFVVQKLLSIFAR